jgi:hypothetical protein
MRPHASTVVIPDRADDELFQDDVRDLADRVRRIAGSGLTAYICDAQTAAEFNGWLDKASAERKRDLGGRLSAVLDLAVLFRQARSITRMKAWLREPAPYLDGMCPADVIRRSANDMSVSQLHEAADRYLETYVPWYRPRVPLR